MCTVFRLGVQYQMFTATPSIDASEHINPVVILYVYIYEKKKSIVYFRYACIESILLLTGPYLL